MPPFWYIIFYRMARTKICGNCAKRFEERNDEGPKRFRERKTCSISCGQMLRRDISGRTPTLSSNGYLIQYLKGGGRIYQHRQVMETALGRKLRDNEQVHHKNRNRRDNRLENLQVVTQEQHLRLHQGFFTEAEILSAINKYFRETPNGGYRDYKRKKPGPSMRTIERRFGSWAKACQIASAS